MRNVYRNLRFAEVQEGCLELDLYVPETRVPPPLVVWIHGGAWRAGSRAKPPLRKLVDCGYALASISHRFTDQAIFPAQIHDIKAAIRWLRAQAAKYGVDPRWIAATGNSSGGHLAMLLGCSAGNPELEGRVGGYWNESSAVQVVVSYFGPSDFVLRGKTQPDWAYTERSGSFALLGGKQTGHVDPRLEKTASPVNYVGPNSPPLLMFHGDRDEVVLLDQSLCMLEVCLSNGLDANLEIVQGAGHGGPAFFWGRNFDRVHAFLDRNCPCPPV